VTREDREQFVKILYAHAQTIEVCEACAVTTRDLASEIQRGGLPKRDDLRHTVEEAEKALAELDVVRAEVRRLLTQFS
jgi:hypothetical protein